MRDRVPDRRRQDRHFRRVVRLLVIAWFVLAAAMVGGFVQIDNISDGRSADRRAVDFDACERGNGVRREIRAVSDALRRLVNESVRNAPERSTLTPRQRIALDRLRLESRRLEIARGRLARVECAAVADPEPTEKEN